MDLTLGEQSRLTLTAPRNRVKSACAKSRHFVGSAACLLLIFSALTSRAQLAEQEETGRVTTTDGGQLPYTIRLLPPASFPELPAAIRRNLLARGCLVPQTYEARQPENVIEGSFERPGSADWAVLCSVKGVTSLLVFFASGLASGPSQPATLATSKDTAWLAIEGDRVRGFAWGIDAVPSSDLPRGLAPDHDAVSDAFIEHTARLHYFTEGRWITVDRDNE